MSTPWTAQGVDGGGPACRATDQYMLQLFNRIINNYDIKVIDSMAVYCIENLGLWSAKQLFELNNFLLDNLMSSNGRTMAYHVDTDPVNMSLAYDSLLSQDQLQIRSLLMYSNIVKLLCMIHRHCKNNHIELEPGIKKHYIAYREKAISSIQPSVKRLQKVIDKYMQNLSGLDEDQIEHQLDRGGLIAQNIYVQATDFVGYRELREAELGLQPQGQMYINLNSGFNPDQVLSWSGHSKLFEEVTEGSLDAAFKFLYGIAAGGRKSAQHHYRHSFVLDKATDIILACTLFKPVVVCYLSLVQNSIINYELQIVRQVFGKGVNTSHELDKLGIHVKCIVMELFDGMLAYLIRQMGLFELLSVAHYLVQRSLLDNVSTVVYRQLSTQLDKALAVQVLNVQPKNLRHSRQSAKRIQEVLDALHSLSASLQGLSDCQKQRSVAKLLQLDSKAGTLRGALSRVAQCRQGRAQPGEGALAAPEPPNDGFLSLSWDARPIARPASGPADRAP